MRKTRMAVIASFLVVACLALFPASQQAQTRDRFVISARAGGINAVTGRAAVRGHGNSEWQQLTITEDLETGDFVKTGSDGRVEMLLNPGSYLRIGENSEFELANSSLDNLELRLIRGTAIVEATGAENTALQINITTPHAKLAIVRRGLYRLNVVPGDATELIVRKGRVMLDRSHTKIQGGNKVVFNSDTFFIAKLEKADKKKTDGLESWSKERAETVAEANRKIRRREMAMIMAGLNDPWSRGFSSSGSGYWFFNPRFGCYTFIPFMMGWGSPYGSSYSSAMFGYNYCCGRNYLYAPPSGVAYGAGGSSSTSTGGSTSGSPSPGPAPVPMSEPRQLSPALQQRIDRHTDRMPNP
jgi:hypothetical protein